MHDGNEMKSLIWLACLLSPFAATAQPIAIAAPDAGWQVRFDAPEWKPLRSQTALFTRPQRAS